MPCHFGAKRSSPVCHDSTQLVHPCTVRADAYFYVLSFSLSGIGSTRAQSARPERPSLNTIEEADPNLHVSITLDQFNEIVRRKLQVS